MFIHIGNNIMIPKKEIIAILNVNIRDNKDNKIRSYIITDKNHYDSVISCETLKKRFNSKI